MVPITYMFQPEIKSFTILSWDVKRWALEYAETRQIKMNVEDAAMKWCHHPQTIEDSDVVRRRDVGDVEDIHKRWLVRTMSRVMGDEMRFEDAEMCKYDDVG